jgi:hypothetical protein
VFVLELMPDACHVITVYRRLVANGAQAVHRQLANVLQEITSGLYLEVRYP